jgi:UDP-2,3-diacylglucosamine pyrophosphatase LpxH
MSLPNELVGSREVRAIFISDVHLGSRFCRPELVQRFLQDHQPEFLYLVGDFIDGRALKRRWNWPQACTELLRQMMRMVHTGTQVFYTPGNHDDYLREHFSSEPPLHIQDQFIHHCADGRRLVVLHGDQFDAVEGRAVWLSHLGSVGYEVLQAVDRGVNCVWKLLSRRPLRISKTVKQTVKKCVQRVSGFEAQVVQHARDNDCQGAVCGHIHVPRYCTIDDVLYINLGDWIENATALVEYMSGELELLHLDGLADSVTRTRQHSVEDPIPVPMPQAAALL